MASRLMAWCACWAVLAGCSGEESSPGASTGGSSSGGVAGIAGSGGSASGGGGGGGLEVDPTLDCPSKPYPTPPTAILTGDGPSLASSFRFGTADSEGIRSIAPYANGDVLVSLWKRAIPKGTESAVLARLAADGSTVWVKPWPAVPGRTLVGTDASGEAYVAGVANAPFVVDGVTVGTALQPGEWGFLYAIALDETGNVAWAKVFPATSVVELYSFAVNPAGELALGGALLGSINWGAAKIEVPPFTSGTLRVAFATRLSALGELSFSRMFPGTGVHGQPPPLEGQGGTDGLGHSAMYDVTWATDGSILGAVGFHGALDLGTASLPNDNTADVAVVRLDSAGTTAWHEHLVSLMAEEIEPPQGTGGAGTIVPEGTILPASVAQDAQQRVVVTGTLQHRARIGDVVLQAGAWGGRFTAVFGPAGALVGAVAEGGSEVAVDASGKLVFSDEARIFGMQANGTVDWSRTLGGKLVVFGPPQYGIRPQLVSAGDGLLLAGSFVGGLDLGGAVLESAGCSDAFVARFAP